MNKHRTLKNDGLREQLAAQLEIRRFEQDSAQVDMAWKLVRKDGRTKPGTTVHTVIKLIFDQFPYAKRDGQKSKTEVAIEAAMDELSDALSYRQMKDVKSIELARSIARRTLFRAGQIVYKKDAKDHSQRKSA